MLHDWYFCCCINADPDKSAIFLEILDGLEGAEHNPEFARIAIGELGRMDVWMQGYALPAILRRLGRQAPVAELHASINRYFVELSEALPEGFSEPFEELRDSLFGTGRSGETIAALRRCALTLPSLPARQPSAVPYVDLRDFLPEAIVLAVIADRLPRDGSYASLLGDSDETAAAVVSAMLEAALRHELGRLAFRLALRVARLGGSRYAAEQLADLLWRSRFITELEPDLLVSWAELLFADHRGRPALVEALLEESVTLGHLRRRIGERLGRKRGAGSALSALLPVLSEEIGRPLATVLWQSVLWHHAVHAAPAEAASRLAVLWRRPGPLTSEPLTIRVALPGDSRKELREDLFFLRQLRQTQIHLNIAGASRLELPDSIWVLFSPWVSLNPNRNVLKRLDPETPRYPAALNLAVQVRLVAASILSGKLLLSLPREHPDRPAFAALVAHASDVLETLRLPGGVPGVDRTVSQEHPRVTPAFLRLAIYAQRSIQMVGSCQDERLAPEDFLASLRQTGMGERTELSYDEAAFVRTILPSVLMSWVQEGFLSAARTSSSRRWLDRVPELYSRQGPDLWRHQLNAELVTRFLHPEVPRSKTDFFDWRRASARGEPLHWRVKHRQLLITPQLQADEWERPGWDESTSEDSTKLVRGLERLAALKEPGSLDPEGETAMRWRREWVDLLSRVNNPRFLDRFVRLRLLEVLLDDSILQEDLAGRELIALTLLEYGSQFELERLFDQLYPVQAEGWSVTPDRATHDLQRTLLHALYQEVDFRRDGGEPRPNPQDLYHVHSVAQKDRLIRETLRRIAYFTRESSVPYWRRLREALTSLYTRSLMHEVSRLRKVEAEIELRARSKWLLLPPEEGAIAEWQIRSVAFDPNLLTGKLLVEDRLIGDAFDLFSLPREEVQAFFDRRKPAYVVAVAVGSPPSGVAPPYILYFNCGFRHYLKATTNLRFENGEMVRLRIVWREGNDRPEVDPQYSITWLPLRHSTGRTKRLQLRESRRGGAAATTLELNDGGDTTWPPDREVWGVDLARFFRPIRDEDLRSADREVYAIAGGPGGAWRPVDRGLTQLLLSPAGFRPEGVAALSYLGAEADPKAWRFSVQPGEVYLLAESDFAEEDADDLADEIERHRNPRGLLVAVRAEEIDGRIRLRLAQNPIHDVELASVYPQLQIPFDTRNLVWRDMFRSGNIETAYPLNRSWKVDVRESLPRFPSRVHVYWKGWPEEDGEVEMMVMGWNPWKGEITGRAVQTSHVELPDDRTPLDFVRKWLGLQKGDRIRLQEALGTVNRDGDIHCLTEDGLVVRAESESLSMRFLPSEEALEFHGERFAEVVTVKWFAAQESPALDPETLPAQVRSRGMGEGVLVRIPKRASAAGTLCEIWWDLGSAVAESTHQVENIARLKAVVGARITAEERNGKWDFKLMAPAVKVRALWTVAEWRRPVQSLAYLGQVLLEGDTRIIAEDEPGRLLVLPADTETRRHLAEGNGLSFKGGLGPDKRTENAGGGNVWRIGQNEFRRALLPFRDTVICGTCWADAPARNIVVSQVRLALEPREKGFFTLRRTFRLSSAETIKAERVRIQDDAALWQARLAEYLASPQDLVGSLDVVRREVRITGLRVPSDDSSGRWIQTVPLAEDEGPYITSAAYATDGVRLRLFEAADGRILGSFKRVPPRTIDGFRSDLGNPEFDQFIKLERRLYYASSQKDPEGGDETWHSFEWGYGWTLAAPESRLRFNGEPFQTAQPILFIEDAITGLTFLRGAAGTEEPTSENAPALDDSAESAGAETSLLSIESLHLAVSDATSLFLQRSRYRIVHLLQLTTRMDGGFEIRSILGLEEKGLEMTRTFQVERATLDPASEEELRQRWSPEPASDEGDGKPKQRIVLARLDVNRFRSSLGLEVIFRHVRMSFLQGRSTSLEQSEMVFVRGGRILQLKNDTGLQLFPWKGLDDQDVGEDCRRLLLLRRPFSVREDLLPRIFDAQGEEALEDSALLVNLTNRSGRVSSALWWDEERLGGARKGGRATPRIPSRTLGALHRAASEAVVLASIVQASSSGLQIELKPGVFVTLPASSIAGRPRDLRSGALVRIENAGARTFRLTRATESEDWFVPPEGRLAVALPMNTLLDAEKVRDPRNTLFWLGAEYPNECFSIGGLPNVLAVPGRYDERREGWEDPVPWDFITLMQTAHPKVAVVGRDERGIIRLWPAPPASPAGRLSIDRERLAVQLIPRDGVDGARPVRWELLSFADEPISSLALRCEREKWRYHDTSTGTWHPSGSIESQRLGDHTALGGPLFFEPQGEDLSLRYSEPLLARYGFPVRELVRALLRRKKDRTIRCPIAGLLPDEGLWIELAPGRIVSLPASLMVAEIEGHEKSLSHLHWPWFAPGDQITLKLSSSDPMTVDRIALEEWMPGPRQAFGRRAYLPVLAVDRERGAVRLGGGELQLDLPMRWREQPPPPVVLLSANNHLSEVLDFPERGETVLLGVSDDGLPIVLGFPELRPQPDAQQPASWELDPLADDVAALSLQALQRDKQLGSAIRAAGGALAVTVELVVARHNVLFFSRRLQRAGSILPEGRVILGRVTGLLRDGETVLLLCGSGLVKAPLRRLISGLPPDLNQLAVETLRQSQIRFWLRGSKVGELVRCGLGDEPGSTFNVKVLGVLGGEQKIPSGVVCRSESSLALYWLPAREAAWTRLSADELEKVFARNRRCRVRLSENLCDSPSISLIGVAEVRHELAALGIGKELAVQVLARRGDGSGEITRYVVETRGSHIALEVEAYGETSFEEGQPILVEVIRRSLGPGSQPMITAVLVGKKRYFLDLPAWMVDGRREPKTLRSEFKDYLGWLDEPPVIQGSGNIQSLTDRQLHRGLCHAWRLRPEGPSALAVTLCQIRLANEWLHRFLSMAEMDLCYALISILLLQKTAERGAAEIAALQPDLSEGEVRSFLRSWRKQAFEAFQNLGQRALRSTHVEVLWRDWLRPEVEPSRVGDLRNRLGELEQCLRPSLDLAQLRAFQQYFHAVELRESLPGYRNLVPLSDALRRATGDLERTDTLLERADILRVLIEIYRSLPAGRSGEHPDLLGSHVRELERLLRKINNQRIDITLLEPLTGDRIRRGALGD